MRTLVIAPDAEAGKGRAFRAVLLAHVEANPLWPGGASAGDVVRPIWMSVACSEGDAGPFLANVRSGRKAEMHEDNRYGKHAKKLELLRSAGYTYATQRFPEGTVITAYLDALFRLDPGMVDPAGAKFVLLPEARWAAEQAVDADAAVEHVLRAGFDRPEAELRALVVTAALFATFLDRRTRAPLVQDHRFYLQVLVAALGEGLASLNLDRGSSWHRDEPWGQHRALGFQEHDTANVGLLPGVAFHAKHDKLEVFLAEQVDRYFQAIEQRPRKARAKKEKAA